MHGQFLGIMEQCIPKSTISPRHNLPWMSQNIRMAIKKRNMIYRKTKKSKRQCDMDKYRTELDDSEVFQDKYPICCQSIIAKKPLISRWKRAPQ